jgi:hypothetical protein
MKSFPSSWKLPKKLPSWIASRRIQTFVRGFTVHWTRTAMVAIILSIYWLSTGKFVDFEIIIRSSSFKKGDYDETPMGWRFRLENDGDEMERGRPCRRHRYRSWFKDSCSSTWTWMGGEA